MQDYKSLCTAIMICDTLINIQTHRHTDRQHFDTAYMNSLYENKQKWHCKYYDMHLAAAVSWFLASDAPGSTRRAFVAISRRLAVVDTPRSPDTTSD